MILVTAWKPFGRRVAGTFAPICKAPVPALVALMLGILQGCGSPVASPANRSYLSIQQVKAAQAESKSWQTVRFRGQITVLDSVLNFLVIQDEKAGLRVHPSGYVDGGLLGHTVEIEGQIAPGANGEVLLMQKSWI